MTMMLTVRNSRDKKLGGMAATYRPVGTTCPQDCPLLDTACYAQQGRVDLHQKRSQNGAGSLDDLAGVDLVRHFVSGDAFFEDRLDTGVVYDIISFHERNPGTVGYGYTHRGEDWVLAGMGPATWPSNLAILASCHTPVQRELYKDLGFKTARVIDRREQRELGEMFCPYDLHKFQFGHKRPNTVTCRECKACFVGDRDIAFIKF